MSNHSMEKRAPSDYRDIPPEEVLFKMLAIVFVCCIALSVIIWGVYFYTDHLASTSNTEEKNQKIETFNALPSDTRKIVKEVASGLDWVDDESNTLKLANAPWIFPLSDANAFQWGVILLTFIAMSFAVFICYVVRKNRYYYLADFPLQTAYGWVLLIFCLPIGWPFLLVSYSRMKHNPVITAALADEKKKKLSATAEPSAEPEKTEPDEDIDADFATLRVRLATLSKEEILDDLNKKIFTVKDKLKRYGRYIQECQEQLGELQSRRNLVEQHFTDYGPMNKEKALEELAQIRQMRGVTRIILEQDGFTAQVQVRVKYCNRMYDFGDFNVTFSYNSVKTTETRSGVKEYASNYEPCYRIGNYFCFGDRASEINDYARRGHIIEALTLIIDCMHSVNPEDQKYIPECFRRVPKTKKNKRRWGK